MMCTPPKVFFELMILPCGEESVFLNGEAETQDIGSGNSYFWQDNWLGIGSIDEILSTHSTINTKVSSFICDGRWKKDMLALNVPKFIIEIILHIPIDIRIPDKILCKNDNDGKFKINRIWDNICVVKHKISTLSLIWNNALPRSSSINC